MGVSPQQNSEYKALTSGAAFGQNQGESDILAGTNFMKSILSGDATKQAQALAPEISAAKTSASQDAKTSAMFGPRSGGTTASNAAANDRVHSDITNLIGNLTGSSASGLVSTGTSLFGAGLGADATGFDEASKLQQQKAAKLNDIISSSASVAAGVLGALPGNPGGFLDNASNAAGAIS